MPIREAGSEHMGPPREDLGAELGKSHLSEGEVVGITVSGFIPAVGIATVPAFVASYAGLSAWFPLLSGTVTFTAIAFLIRVFARRYVGTGSLFSYIREVMGNRAGVLMAAALIPGYMIAVTALFLAVGLYAGSFLVSIGLDDAGGTGWQIAIAAATTLITTGIVYRGIDVSVKASVLLTAISLPIILLITGAVLFRADLDLGEQLSLEGLTVDGFLQGMAIGAAFYVGFESTASLGAETRNPRRVIPRALLIVPLGLGTLYTLAAFIQVPTLVAHGDDLAVGMSPPAVLANAVGMGGIAAATDLILAVAIFASVVAFTNYGARVLASAANQGLMPAKLLHVHPRYKSPTVALLAVIAPAFFGPVTLLLVSDTTPLDLYGISATLLTYAWVVPYVLVSVGAALVLRKEGRRWAPTMALSVVVSASVLWLYVNGILNPGPAPLNAMPYVMAIIFGLFALSLAFAWRRQARAGASIDL